MHTVGALFELPSWKPIRKPHEVVATQDGSILIGSSHEELTVTGRLSSGRTFLESLYSPPESYIKGNHREALGPLLLLLWFPISASYDSLAFIKQTPFKGRFHEAPSLETALKETSNEALKEASNRHRHPQLSLSSPLKRN